MNIFQAVKERVRIIDVVGEYTTLKRMGGYFKANCPFHHERTASFTVTPDREIFYCFGCRAGGDVVEFIAQIEKCSAREAALHLIERYKLVILDQELAGSHGESWTMQQRYFEACKLVARWCAEQLKIAPEIAAYLKKRSISAESIERFGIGYFPGGEKHRKRLVALVQKEGFLVDDLLAARIFMRQEQRFSNFYSPFEERIILPIHDHLGRVCGFGGRTFHADDTRAKYYNSHEHAYFSKSSLLFGFDQAKRLVQKTGKIYVVEGYFDCIAMVQAGIGNVVATLGTACTDDHLKLLGRYVKHVIVMYDGDVAGINATMKLSEACWEYELELHVVILPSGQDPADFFGSGGDFAALPHYDVFTFYIHALREQFNGERSLSDKIHALRDILKRIARVTNPLTQDLLIHQIATVCNVSVAMLSREVKFFSTKAADAKVVPRKKGLSIPPLKEGREENLFAERAFCIVISCERALSKDEYDLISGALPMRLRTLLKQLQDDKCENPQFRFSDFFAKMNKNDQEYVQWLIAVHGPQLDKKASHEHLVTELYERCQAMKWKRLVEDFKVNIAIAQEERNHEKLQQLLSEFQHIKKTMKK